MIGFDKITQSIAEAYKVMQSQKYGVIYCDMDGVLADMLADAQKILGHPFDQKDPNLDVETSKRKTREDPCLCKSWSYSS